MQMLYRLLSGQYVAVYAGVDGRRRSPTRGKRCIGIAVSRAPRDFTDTGRPMDSSGKVTGLHLGGRLMNRVP